MHPAGRALLGTSKLAAALTVRTSSGDRSGVLRWSARQRQGDPDRGSVIDLALDPQCTAVGHHNMFDNGQPQARSPQLA